MCDEGDDGCVQSAADIGASIWECPNIPGDGKLRAVVRLTSDGVLEPGEGLTLSAALCLLERGGFTGLAKYFRWHERHRLREADPFLTGDPISFVVHLKDGTYVYVGADANGQPKTDRISYIGEIESIEKSTALDEIEEIRDAEEHDELVEELENVR